MPQMSFHIYETVVRTCCTCSRGASDSVRPIMAFYWRSPRDQVRYSLLPGPGLSSSRYSSTSLTNRMSIIRCFQVWKLSYRSWSIFIPLDGKSIAMFYFLVFSMCKNFLDPRWILSWTDPLRVVPKILTRPKRWFFLRWLDFDGSSMVMKLAWRWGSWKRWGWL